MEEILQALVAAQSAATNLKTHIGKGYGSYWGICSNRADPENQGRIKVLLPNKGGSYETYWLTRVEPCPGLSLPVPRVGDTVEVVFDEGDFHRGEYIGVAQNKINPAFENIDGLELLIGNVTLRITPEGVVHLSVLPGTDIVLECPQVTVKGNFAIEGNMSVLGALDTETNTRESTFALQNCVSAYINNSSKQLATLGAVDDDDESDGADTLVTKGW